MTDRLAFEDARSTIERVIQRCTRMKDLATMKQALTDLLADIDNRVESREEEAD